MQRGSLKRYLKQSSKMKRSHLSGAENDHYHYNIDASKKKENNHLTKFK